MELKRGKTFIKSSLQISHEKPPDPAATAPVREDAGPWSVSPGGQQRPYSERAPQMPFVPAVAKSIPRKRISLKRPKKCFRNLFHIRRNKTENLASLVTKRESLSSPGGPSEAGGQTDTGFFPFGEGLGPDGLCQDLSDSELLPDSSFDLCRALCEDVASLKSFDSLTGCGEIFADESSVPSLELNEGLESPTQVSQALENKVLRGPFQGSMEQLASPAQNEMSDFAKFWDSVNRSVRQQHSTLLGPWLGSPQGTDTDRPRLDTAGLAELPLCPCRDPHSGSKASSIDTGTPKSEQPESVSTSDEGYYDSFSPGLEEDKKEVSSPGTPAAAFPRDSYSGDALYELFYDPSEGPVGPSLDDDLCVSESLSGPALGAPLSMCSFHVGAEENLAPTPGPDLLSQSFLQSSWKGKECLLKLCDTELAITMGIINWLRRSPELRTPPASAPGDTATSPRGQTEKLEAGSEQKSPGPVKLEVRGPGASDAGRTIVGSVPSRRELWAHSLTKGLLAGESKVLAGPEQVTSSLSRDPSLECVQVSGEGGTQGCYEGLFSPVGSATSATDTCSKNKVSNLWPSSQEPRPPGNLEYFRGSWRPGPGESTLDVEPTLTGCAAQVAALQIQPDCQPPTKQPPRQDMSSGLCRQPQTRGPEILQQKQPNSFPSVAVSCGLPSLGSPLHSSQDQRCPGHVLDLSQLRVEHTRMDAQSRASVEDQPL
uniref:APC membrane recruitment protein 3 n=1 Tax=Felis catus TaxID=9685 RepID=A0ABI8A5U1_FELCA